ncbi:MAG TPA: YdcF family protein [Candidatus Aquicultor sp.]
MFKLFFEPVIWILILLIVALVFLRELRNQKELRFGWYIMLGTAVSLYALSTGLIANALSYAIESAAPRSHVQDIKQADVIVILGGGAAPSTGFRREAEPIDWDRLVAGIDAFKRAKARRLILSGGQGKPGEREAEVMRHWALRFGVPAKSITIETSSQTTLEQAREVEKILKKSPQPVIGLVTSGLHMRRAAWCFNQCFKTVIPYPSDSSYDPITLRLKLFAPTSSSLLRSAESFHELAGYFWYRIQAL